MSRTGCCCDNATMERFFWSLKHEWANHENYIDLDDARMGVFKYIHLFYNPTRIYQALGYLSPEQYEAEHPPATQAAWNQQARWSLNVDQCTHVLCARKSPTCVSAWRACPVILLRISDK